MKLAAVAPVLFVLVSFCGSPVPAPGGSVSGLVFYDANRNGIHDSCDSPLPHVAVIATGANGKTALATATADGAFHIEHVPSGDGLLTLAPGEGYLWPITTTTGDGLHGVIVHVEELEDTAGAEIGSASRTAFASEQVAITGIIFEDSNANGEIDVDECGIPYAAVEQVRVEDRTSSLRADGTYELLNLIRPGAVSLAVNPASSGNGLGAMTDWTPTTGDGLDAGSPCGPSIRPTLRYGPHIYEANIGFTYQRNVGSVTGILFEDTNGDGVRDEGEAGVANASIYLQPVDPSCGGYIGVQYPSTDGSGSFQIRNVAPGVYTAILQWGYMGEVGLPPTGLLAPGWDPEMTITVRGHTSTTLDLPALYKQGATVRVTTFDDANDNGSWDDGERALEGVSVCLLPPSAYPGYSGGVTGFDTTYPMKQAYPQSSCVQTGPDGSGVNGPLLEGEYLQAVELFTSPYTPVPQEQLSLKEGDELDLYIPIQVLQPEAQIIAEGAGEPIEFFDTCYSDPDWVQPPFEDGYGKPMPYGSEWPPESDARAMYSHGIYLLGGSQVSYIWALIAGLEDWISNPPPACTYSLPTTSYVTVDLAGYEPLEAVGDGNVRQITLAKRETGLYAVNLELSLGNNQQWYLFVDESDRPLARCGSFSYQCEWFN